MDRYVLDASALMTFFEDRPGAERVQGLLLRAGEVRRPLLMSVVNWGEVYYSVWRAHGERVAESKLRDVAQLPVVVVEADAELTKLAASLKAQHNLPYADCFAAALAHARKAALVATDRDFERVAGSLKIFWI
jgi:predicted nucleic acid-binding protein